MDLKKLCDKEIYSNKDIPIDIIWLNRNHNYSSTHLKAEIYNSVKYRKDRELRFD